MSARLAAFGLLGLAGYAMLATAVGSGAGTPDAAAGRLGGRCVVLSGDAWRPAKCAEPAAVVVASDETGATGDMGAEGYGGTLTPAQIRDLWIAHGGDPSTAGVAAAVARAESGGRPGATNRSNSNGTVDRGLFQINSIHGAHSTYDLDANVAFAVQLSHGGHDWSPWVAYTSGAYRRYLGATT